MWVSQRSEWVAWWTELGMLGTGLKAWGLAGSAVSLVYFLQTAFPGFVPEPLRFQNN